MIRSQSASAAKSSVGLEIAHRLFDLLGGKASLGGARLVILAHQARAAVERLLPHLDDRHRNAGRQEVHRNTAAHRAGADHPDLADRPRLGVFRQAVDLVRLALGKEEILLRLGLGAAHQLHEQFALVEHALAVRLLARDLDRLDVRFGRVEAAELARILLAKSVERLRIALVELVLPFGALGQRANVANFLGIGDCVRDQLAFDEPVDQPAVERVFGRDRISRRAHLQGLAHAGDARQPLRPARARQQAELHFRRAELRGRNRDAIVAGKRNLEPAAERRAVDRGDHRLGASLDDVDHLRQHRLFERLGCAELRNVGAGEERLALAGDHDRVHAVVSFRLLDRGGQSLPNSCAERVHRRIVRQDDQHIAMLAGRNRAGRRLVHQVFHRGSPERRARPGPHN